MRVSVWALCGAAVALGHVGPERAVAQSTCDRACLEGFVEDYLAAMVDDDPAAVRFARDVKFTEHGQRLELGDGLWNTMKSKDGYRLFVTDVEAGQVAVIGTIAEDHRDPNQQTPALIALRLKVENGAITEAEQQVVRDADAAQRVAALGDPDPIYLETVPANERMSREDLIAVSNKYFTGMQRNDGQGDYPFAEDCNRLENGTQTTNRPLQPGQTAPDPTTATSYSVNWSCLEQFESGLLHFVNRIRDRRFVAVDRERGLTFAFGFFDHSGGEHRTFETPDGRTVTAGPVQPWTWYIAEIFKVTDGEIRRIEATLDQVPYGMLSGWSTYEEGMSDEVRDVTM